MDERISSRCTIFLKWLLPPLGLYFFGYEVVEIEAMGQTALAACFAFGGAVFLVVYRFLVWDLADEVYDEVTQLRIRRRGVWESIPYENIRDVSFFSMARPPYAVLWLVKPGALGKQIAFLPIFTSPFSRTNPYVEQLTLRAKAARTKPPV